MLVKSEHTESDRPADTLVLGSTQECESEAALELLRELGFEPEPA
jgi:hypothetical protein